MGGSSGSDGWNEPSIADRGVSIRGNFDLVLRAISDAYSHHDTHSDDETCVPVAVLVTSDPLS